MTRVVGRHLRFKYGFAARQLPHRPDATFETVDRRFQIIQLREIDGCLARFSGQPVTTLESYAKEAARRIENGDLTPSDLSQSVGYLVKETERLR